MSVEFSPSRPWEDSPTLSFGEQEKPFSPHFPGSVDREDSSVQHEIMPELSLQSVSPPLVVDSFSQEEGAATARFPTRREEVEEPMKRSKSSSRLRSIDAKQSSKPQWDSVLTKVVQEKMSICGNRDDLVGRKAEVLWEVRRRIETRQNKAEVDCFINRASDPDRFREEATRAFASFERQKHARRPQSLNWTQLQVLKEKEKLARVMQKFSRVK